MTVVQVLFPGLARFIHSSYLQLSLSYGISRNFTDESQDLRFILSFLGFVAEWKSGTLQCPPVDKT